MAVTVAARNRIQLAVQEATFVVLNSPPFRAWKSDAAYCSANQPHARTPTAIAATELASSIEGAVNQRRRRFDKSLRRMACLTLIALTMSPTVIRTNVTELRAQRVARGGQLCGAVQSPVTSQGVGTQWPPLALADAAIQASVNNAAQGGTA